MNPSVTFQAHDGIGLLRIDAPPVNALSLALVAQIREAVRRFAAAQELQALVIGTAGRTFVAGADVREFSDPGFDHRHFGDLMRVGCAFGGPITKR